MGIMELLELMRTLYKQMGSLNLCVQHCYPKDRCEFAKITAEIHDIKQLIADIEAEIASLDA